MAEREIPIHSSLVIQFIDRQEMREDNQYHAFEFVLVNFIPKEGRIPRPKLAKAELTIGKYKMSQDYQLGMGLGKDGNGIINPINLKCHKKYI